MERYKTVLYPLNVKHYCLAPLLTDTKSKDLFYRLEQTQYVILKRSSYKPVF